MPPLEDKGGQARHDGWGTLRRFLPYLWPRENPRLRWRIAGALLLVLAAKATTLALPFFYKGAVDRMTGAYLALYESLFDLAARSPEARPRRAG